MLSLSRIKLHLRFDFIFLIIYNMKFQMIQRRSIYTNWIDMLLIMFTGKQKLNNACLIIINSI
jgi:hypothetical protein